MPVPHTGWKIAAIQQGGNLTYTIGTNVPKMLKVLLGLFCDCSPAKVWLFELIFFEAKWTK